MSDIPHYIGCDLAVYPSEEDPPAFAEAVYKPRFSYDQERALYRLDLTIAEFEARHRLEVAVVALLVFFALGFLVGTMA
jgi:hypothetical protein